METLITRLRTKRSVQHTNDLLLTLLQLSGQGGRGGVSENGPSELMSSVFKAKTSN